MELRHLRYFIAVAEELHFSKAAEKLHIAQPPLSQQIQQLEAELGVKLFDRKTKRQVQLTEAGKVFLQEAYQLLEQLKTAVALTQRTGRGETGKLRIGFTSLVIYDLLPLILRKFREQFLAVEIELLELTTSQQEQALRDSLINVGFAHPPLEDDTLSYECIHKETLVVALSSTHSLAQKDYISVRSLLNEPLIMFPRYLAPGLYDRIMSLFHQANFSPNITQEAVQMQTIIGLVSAGMGAAITPSSLQNLQRSGVVYRPILEKAPLIETAIIWQQHRLTPIVENFLKCTQDFMAGNG
ncbi:LysR family transcriptional regulator [Anabaena cylindrica FACHB-243]|uniref:Transcriptional regulator, LysR family n=1 Tax=Anabaena cylindrica (strain ATCC 27899 / PCC 7122) TaxID=272123 RepID=K9ZMW7_ANACC|nr:MULTISPECIES: LysR family transcriptional regulator [Anabaena]AFZ60583.1 transcriptional regulator, LysR family [Anabaena cylindrica PCC 7122]MBD2418286.1 LysR family transcriptional regulator [Anabaena cylindrica FACHB-243]MBY5281768.1 LysR family transcriptional regulator [Anabaena sp. CCAP 1446/1C]MBY5311275.1 LysR family transcriptional regulator [Anabaena sp. CCAP 1446/1C]MCM2408804.1 LysR family transcriptional regulator [Anabaena sp. CCAP 1446/1C]